MQNGPSDGYQIATFVVVVLILLVCMCYLLIFVNPQVALNPFKPPRASPTAVALGLPPTWTPVPTSTDTPTFTPTRTFTPAPTETPTLTPLPTLPPTATPIPPTATATRPTPTRTRRPPTATLPPPTPVPSPYTYRTVVQSCKHSGGTFIEGTVYRTSAGEPEAGIRVALGSGPGPGTGDIYYVTSGTQGRSAGYYVHVIRANGAAPGNYYVWVADSNGNPLSDPNAGRVTTNSISNPDDPAACWLAVVDFVRR